MKAGSKAVLTMERTLCMEQNIDKRTYVCELLAYDIKQAILVFRLQEQGLEELSLDALYQCEIYTEKNITKCVGKIRERYCGSEGKTVKVQVKNGFYIDKE